ncbi:MAG: hypothetical protein JXR42_04165 [Gammaproteobacteria bacterium]|nr:hypothetical protein [Gammaproteobacteria bacterium]
MKIRLTITSEKGEIHCITPSILENKDADGVPIRQDLREKHFSFLIF